MPHVACSFTCPGSEQGHRLSSSTLPSKAKHIQQGLGLEEAVPGLVLGFCSCLCPFLLILKCKLCFVPSPAKLQREEKPP